MSQSPDLVRLSRDGCPDIAARVWQPDGPARGTVLCLHGLTRNSRDFEDLAADLGQHYRVIAPDQRGRGLSGWAEPSTYVLPVQLADTLALLDHLEVDRCAVIGTSMGALMAASLVALARDRIAGVVLNDAGPVIDPSGIARIAGYVGGGPAPRTWDEAAVALKAIHGDSFPTYSPGDWLRLARSTYRQEGDGLRLDYDLRLREALASAAPVGGDLWPVFEALRGIDTVVIRGDRSDILGAETASEMVERLGARLVVVRNRGHAPDLSEAEAVQAIEAFLARRFG